RPPASALGERRRRQQHEEGEPGHAGQLGQLGEGQGIVLGVAQECPWGAAQHPGAELLEEHPGRGCREPARARQPPVDQPAPCEGERLSNGDPRDRRGCPWRGYCSNHAASAPTMLLTDRRVLHPLVGAVAGVTLVCVVDSTAWVHRPFMGFLLGRNRIVAPNALGHWSGFHAGVPFGGKLIAVDGRPGERVPDLVAEPWAGHAGTPVRYTFLTPAGRVERTVPIMRFGLADYVSLFGVLLVNGAVFLVLG